MRCGRSPESAGVNPWKDGKAHLVKRVDYEPVGMVSAAPGGARWFHQHFGVSKDPLRLTAWFGPHNPGREPGPPGEKHIDYTGMDITEGGSAIPYWMEDPFIAKEYTETLKRNGRKYTTARRNFGFKCAPMATIIEEGIRDYSDEDYSEDEDEEEGEC